MTAYLVIGGCAQRTRVASEKPYVTVAEKPGAGDFARTGPGPMLPDTVKVTDYTLRQFVAEESYRDPRSFYIWAPREWSDARVMRELMDNYERPWRPKP